MTKLTHAELASAQERKDWPALWEHALPIVRMAVRRMSRNDTSEEREDLEQEGMVIAGVALRRWRPLECTLSTHIANQVGWGLVKYRGRERNRGIGSYEQTPAVLSLGDTRDESASGGEQSTEDEDVDDSSFEAALTYEGVLRRYTGQVDGQGYVPEGYGDPSELAEQGLLQTDITAALKALSPLTQQLITSVHGFEGKPISLRTIAQCIGLSYGTAQRLYSAGLDTLGQKLRNS